jgi:hypothetical protein
MQGSKSLKEVFEETKQTHIIKRNADRQQDEQQTNLKIEEFKLKAQTDFEKELKNKWDRLLIKALQQNKRELPIRIGYHSGEYSLEEEYTKELVRLAIAHIAEAGLSSVNHSSVVTIDNDNPSTRSAIYEIKVHWRFD